MRINHRTTQPAFAPQTSPRAPQKPVRLVVPARFSTPPEPAAPKATLLERLKTVHPDVFFKTRALWKRGIYAVLRSTVPYVVSAVIYLAAKIMFKSFKIEGAEILRKLPKGRPVIFIANHGSYLDPPLIGAAITLCYGRIPWTVASATLYEESKLFHFLFPILRAIPFKRRLSDEESAFQSMKDLVAILRAKQAMFVFPEGTMGGNLKGSEDGIHSLRSQLDSETGLLASHPFIAMLAYVTGALIVPIGGSGLEKAMPPEIIPGKLYPRRKFRNHSITLKVGEPIDVTQMLHALHKGDAGAPPSRSDFARLMKKTVMPALSKLIDFSQAEIPHGVPLTEDDYARFRAHELQVAKDFRAKFGDAAADYEAKVKDVHPKATKP